MTLLVSIAWTWLAAAFGLGFVAGLVGRDGRPMAAGTRKVALGGVIVLVVAAAALWLSGALGGREAFWLDLAILMGSVYAAGAAGGFLVQLARSRQVATTTSEAVAAPFMPEPVAPDTVPTMPIAPAPAAAEPAASAVTDREPVPADHPAPPKSRRRAPAAKTKAAPSDKPPAPPRRRKPMA